MVEKSADIQTLAPRLSYVEDQAKWLMDNRGSGGGGVDQKLWRATVQGAEEGFSWSEEPWTQTDLIYGPDSTNQMSMHQTVFGTNSAPAIASQDGKGFYGRVFPSDDIRWNYDESGTRSLVDDLFAGPDFVAALRALDTSLCRAIWHTDTSQIGYSRDDTIIGKLEQLRDDLQEGLQSLRDDFNWQNNFVEGQLDAIRARLAAGGL
ncbi:hypothetical protein GOL99_12115 [Sinorhizobium medicae]|nr:hypothetical protein [Sinorhizobium medicae]